MTSAVKLKRRPPLTTLETRLIVTTRSRNWLSLPRDPRSRFGLRSRPPRRCSRGSLRRSVVEAAVSTGASFNGSLVGGVLGALLVFVVSVTGSIHLLGRRRRWPPRV